MKRSAFGAFGTMAVALLWLGQTCAGADEPIDRAKVIDEQRARSEAAAKVLGRVVKTVESEHFIVHTTLAESEGKGIPRKMEELYRGFGRAMGAGSDDFVWTGKVVVYALSTPEELAEFSRRAHGYAEGTKEAYFRAAGAEAELVVARIADPKKFDQDLMHETAHLLLHFYRKPGLVPNWLQEGLAQWFEFQKFRGSSSEAEARKRVRADSGEERLAQLKELLKGGRPAQSSDLAGYAYSWSFVDFLMGHRRAELKRFVGGLKGGLDEETAALNAFGKNLADVEREWVVWAGK